LASATFRHRVRVKGVEGKVADFSAVFRFRRVTG
jgi:hypothetical protein